MFVIFIILNTGSYFVRIVSIFGIFVKYYQTIILYNFIIGSTFKTILALTYHNKNHSIAIFNKTSVIFNHSYLIKMDKIFKYLLLASY